jgi:UDPglucose 6-dehydrogenase
MEKQQKIGIIGLGILGKTLFDWLEKRKIEVYGYDKFKNFGSLEEVDKAKIIFLCLPTPYDPKTGYDLSALEENIKYFKKPKIFVIKSTVLPGTTEYFQKKYKIHKFLHNPEFLREKSPYEDFIKPDIQLIGYTKESKNLAKEILKLLPQAPYTKIVDSKISELSKLSINDFLSLKVIFANQIYDLCQKLKINYDNLREILENEPRLGKTHFKVFYEGYRGFGGKCLPKELKATLVLYKNKRAKTSLFETIDKINYNLLKKQKLLKRLVRDWLNNKS